MIQTNKEPRFCLKQNMPVLNKDIHYNILKNKSYLDIIKYNSKDNENGLCLYIEELLKYNILEESVYEKLTNYEKFLILLDMRSECIGDIITIISNNEAQLKISIKSVLDSLKNKVKEIELTKQIKNSNLIVEIGIPKVFIINDIDDIYEKSIHTIIIDGETIDFYDLSHTQKLELMDNLPANISSEILKFAQELQNSDIFLISENPSIGLNGVKFSFYDKTMFYFIKSILNEDLKSFYELEYNIINKIRVSRSDFMEMNPEECRIFIDFYNEEMRKQEESSKSNSRMPSMPSMPKF